MRSIDPPRRPGVYSREVPIAESPIHNARSPPPPLPPAVARPRASGQLPLASKDHIPALDGLRGIAVLLVLWAHVPAGFFGLRATVASIYVQPGYLGVDVFFVLSGFLITRILLVDRGRGRPLRHFMIRRFLRIFPIYYLTLAVVALVRPGPELPWCAAYLANFYFAFHHVSSPLQHTWSLSVEEHFYLVWPLLVYLLPVVWSRRVILYGLLPLAAVAAAWTNYSLVGEGKVRLAQDLITWATPFRMLSLSLGALGAYHEAWLRTSAWRSGSIALALLAAGYSLVWSGGNHPFWLLTLFFLGWALFSSGLVLGGIALERAGRAAALPFTNRPLRLVGRISYGLYLYHFPIYYAFGIFDRPSGSLPDPSAMYGAIATTFAVATVSFLLVERPILRLQERFRSIEAPVPLRSAAGS